MDTTAGDALGLTRDVAPRFGAGDLVCCIDADDAAELALGAVYEVDRPYSRSLGLKSSKIAWDPARFEKVSPDAQLVRCINAIKPLKNGAVYVVESTTNLSLKLRYLDVLAAYPTGFNKVRFEPFDWWADTPVTITPTTETSKDMDKPKHTTYQPKPGDRVRCVRKHDFYMTPATAQPVSIKSGYTYTVETNDQRGLALRGQLDPDLRWPADAFEPVQIFNVGDTVRCIDATANAKNVLIPDKKYVVKETRIHTLILDGIDNIEWSLWRFVLMIDPAPCVSDAPGNYEKHDGKPFMGPRTQKEQEMKYNDRDIAVYAAIARTSATESLDRRRCECCGFTEKIEGDSAPWGYWDFAAGSDDEDARLCPSCAKQTAEFIAHLKDKNNPAAASASSGAWYHEDWD